MHEKRVRVQELLNNSNTKRLQSNHLIPVFQHDTLMGNRIQSLQMTMTDLTSSRVRSSSKGFRGRKYRSRVAETGSIDRFRHERNSRHLQNNPGSSSNTNTSSDSVGGSVGRGQSMHHTRPAFQTQPHIRIVRKPPATFCLPIISPHNDHNGNALLFIRLTITRREHRLTTESKEIDRAMLKYYGDCRVTPAHLEKIDRFKMELEVHLSNSLPGMNGRTVQLDTYGSTKNGFGTVNCDVDMSMSFDPSPPEWAFSADSVMKEVAKALLDYPNTLDERYISAKVPIVRFRGVFLDIEADISYENRLALFNTSLLSSYCSADPDRLPALGVWLKTWAKRCGIGDASRGSLSSYAWNLMLIHYLQNTGCPPFLDRLQQIHNDVSKDLYINGWCIYFHQQAKVDKRHAACSVYELFVGFLEYYIVLFRWCPEIVIQIRNVVPPPRPEKWGKFSLCIQDPFELDHNLAQGVDEDMFLYIYCCLMKSREVFVDAGVRRAFAASRALDSFDVSERLIAEHERSILKEYGEFLLHSCTLDREPPVRHFVRMRTTSQCTGSSCNV